MAESPSNKIIPFAAAKAHFESLRLQGRTIVQSHGVFDMVHPGHVAHLEGARALGDRLVVTLTADRHVHKGPGRPYFREPLRMRALAALECVDYVVLIPFSGATEAIQTIRPHIYCKGKEYEDPDFDDSGGLEEEVRAVEAVGGEVRFVGAIKASSTRLLNLYFEHPSAPVSEFCGMLASKYTRRGLGEAVESLADLRVLIVGEAIFDRYAYVRLQGLTSKGRILSGRFLSQETHCGGALAVLRHVRQFTSRVRFLSVLGTEPWVDTLLRGQLLPGEDLVLRDPGYTTIVKERFVEPRRDDEEVSKLFSVNYLNPDPPGEGIQAGLEARFREAAADCDVVMALDFGHGLFQPRFRDLVQEGAPYLALNCQTNSNNHGFNILPRQYRRADAFTLDEQEMLLAAGRRHLDFDHELGLLRRQFGAQYAWLTRGPLQTIGLAEDQLPCSCPPLESDVVDPVGAGDAFFAVAGLAAARRLPIDLATFLGQLAGAQAVRIVGNSHPISKQILIKSGMSLLER
jgi:rfaE bifunctional protein nucleotidyltransferase chain/domain